MQIGCVCEAWSICTFESQSSRSPDDECLQDERRSSCHHRPDDGKLATHSTIVRGAFRLPYFPAFIET